MFKKEVYGDRRNRLKQRVESGLVLLVGNEESSMNFKSNHYPFRQDSSFLYFIGIDQASLVAILDLDNGNELLFGDEQTVTDIVWEGRKIPLQEQAALAGIGDVHPLSKLAGYLQKAIGEKRTVHYLPPYRPEQLTSLSELLQVSSLDVKRGASIPLIKAVVAIRSLKSEDEITEINEAVNITAAMIREVMQNAREGVSEKQLAARLEWVANNEGARISFPPILTVNGQWLHTHASSTVLQKGQMVLCDCGAENNMNYAGDMTRTFPVDKTFTSRQADIYNIVLAAQEAAIASLRPGELHLNVHLLACEIIVEGLKSVGLMKGDSKEAVRSGAHTLFFPCGLGHMMGMDVHDMENLGEQYVGYDSTLKQGTEFGLRSLRLGKKLEKDFVLTVEPGIYMNPDLIDAWEAEKKHTDFINYHKLGPYKNFGGIRIEDDYLITSAGASLLGNYLPKTLHEIENIRSLAL